MVYLWFNYGISVKYYQDSLKSAINQFQVRYKPAISLAEWVDPYIFCPEKLNDQSAMRVNFGMRKLAKSQMILFRNSLQIVDTRIYLPEHISLFCNFKIGHLQL